MSIGNLQDWVGNTEQRQDTIDAGPITRLALALGASTVSTIEGSELPPLWHWIYFLGTSSREDTGDDGHPRRGGFLPPVPLARRMYAGGSLVFHEAVRVGDQLERTSEVMSVEDKIGKSGPLTIVRVKHEISRGGTSVITEEQDLIYTDGGSSSANVDVSPVPERKKWGERFVADEVLLFRFSALTFNSHRIHYDRDYATTVEGHRDLVVHGPLIAMMLAGLVKESGIRLRTFRFRSNAPLYVGDPVHLRGDVGGSVVELAAYDERGVAAMVASGDTT